MLLALFDLNEVQEKVIENENSLPITLILDNVRMPDNIGAISRVAAAIGCKKVITTKVNKNYIFSCKISIVDPTLVSVVKAVQFLNVPQCFFVILFSLVQKKSVKKYIIFVKSPQKFLIESIKYISNVK